MSFLLDYQACYFEACEYWKARRQSRVKAGRALLLVHFGSHDIRILDVIDVHPDLAEMVSDDLSMIGTDGEEWGMEYNDRSGLCVVTVEIVPFATSPNYGWGEVK